mgnify:CR=1 FL=1
MAKYELNGHWYTPNELSEISGIAAPTIRDRLRRGYTVEEAIKMVAVSSSVEEFSEASWWKDWIGMATSDLHKIYKEWCVQNGYTPLTKQGFSRQLFKMFPNLKTVPTRLEDRSVRIIREK